MKGEYRMGFPEILLVDLVALATVVLIDLVLAGDNAVVIGMAAHRLEPRLRLRAIAVGIVLAMIFRIGFASVAAHLMTIVGLLLVGGVLLLWVAWKLWRDMSLARRDLTPSWAQAGVRVTATAGFWTAIVQIGVADVSMSLDNVLAVAGAARNNLWIMGFGLVLSIMLMGIAASYVAKLLNRYAWLNHIGLAVITLVAATMIYHGAGDVLTLVRPGQ
jgi:YjbE family integral membrane protein